MKLPSWSARNPLGIIALFISLIYGMSALLLGASVDSLETYNETILVVFVVLFPFVVLAVFSWLVAKHHRKLYGPGDYRSDRSFIDADNMDDPASLGQRLEREIEEEQAPDSEPNVEVNDEPEQQAEYLPSLGMPSNRMKRRTESLQRAYLAESLVFQDLQIELGGAVKRQVTVQLASGRTVALDGLIQDGQNFTFVEVKRVSRKYSANRMLKIAFFQLDKVLREYTEEERNGARLILAVVIDAPDDEQEEIVDLALAVKRAAGSDVELRIYNYDGLLERFGFPVSSVKDEEQ